MAIPKLLQSSADPTKVSLFVNGLLISILPFALYALKKNGIIVEDTLATAIVEAISAGAASVFVIVGLVRKAVIAGMEPKEPVE